MGIHKQKYKETRIVVRVDLIQADQQRRLWLSR